MASTMNAGKYTRRIPKATWDKHWPEILRLYLEEDRHLEGDNGVRDIMNRLHGFRANVGQYQFMFHKRKVSKKGRSHDWQSVLRCLSQRKKQNKHSIVKLGGRQCTEQQIIDATRHHGQDLMNNDLDEDVMIVIPQDFEVSTPPEDFNPDKGSELVSSSSDSLGASSWDQQPSPSTLGWEYVRLSSEYSSNSEKQGQPFEWHRFLDWPSITHFLESQQEVQSMIRNSAISSLNKPKILAQLPRPSLSLVRTMFWSPQHPDTYIIQAANEVTAKFLLSTLFNSLGGSQRMDLQLAHRWIRILPSNAVLQFFEKLPRVVRNIFRERVFAAALIDRDEKTVKLMLHLGVDAREAILIWPHRIEPPCRPLQIAMRQANYTVAKALTLALCCNASIADLDVIFKDICNEHHINPRNVDKRMSNSKWRDLVSVILRALDSKEAFDYRANIHFRSLEAAVGDQSLLSRLVKIHVGCAADFIKGKSFTGLIYRLKFHGLGDSATILTSVLEYIVLDLQKHHFIDDQKLVQYLQRGIKYVRNYFPWARRTMEEACAKFGRTILEEACAKFGITVTSSTGLLSLVSPPDAYISPADLEQQAIANGELENSDVRISTILKFNVNDVIETIPKLANLRKNEKALETRYSDSVYTLWMSVMLLVLLQYCDTAAVSTLFSAEPSWDAALQRARKEKDYCMLEDVIFRAHRQVVHFLPPRRNISEKERLLQRFDLEQILLRGVAYCAVYDDDHAMFRFAFESGLDVEGICCEYSTDHGIQRPRRGRGSYVVKNDRSFLVGKVISLPSLLTTTVINNRPSLTRLLFDYGADLRDSVALQHAVRRGADEMSLRGLLDIAVGSAPPYRLKGYGAPGLCEAIRLKNHGTLRLLAGKTDVNDIEEGIGDNIDMSRIYPKTLSPLGFAIVNADLRAAQILLEHGADPDALVALDKISYIRRKGSTMRRVSAVLAAIEEESMPMLRILVEHGAHFQGTRKHGLPRAPLQRAAEIGNFEIVNYLLGLGAKVDYNEIRSGGTALQLAAIGGHVGIAHLLLAHGANPNAPPAEGEGRTAFEGAAEWGRPDMVSLLIVSGVHPGFLVGEPPEPQAVRAIRFARVRGHMALMHYIEEIWEQYKRQHCILS